jgi:hypothetical protein
MLGAFIFCPNSVEIAHRQANGETMNEKIEMLRKLVRDVPDFPKKGIIFKDITPILRNANALSTSVVSSILGGKWN